MEGGSPILEWITYGIVGIVLCALGFLFVRTVWFFLSLLAIPLTEAASRWRPTSQLVAQWGERGGRRDPTAWRDGHVPNAPADGVTGSRVRLPASVRRGMGIGAALGALPGLWWAVRGAAHVRETGGSAGEMAAAVGIALGLVAAAGALVGGAVGAGAGLAWDAAASRRG